MNENAGLPLFQNGPGIKRGFGLSLPRLMGLVEQGAVRTIKFGASKQAGRLYSTRDVECALEKMAVGKKPKAVRLAERKKTGEQEAETEVVV